MAWNPSNPTASLSPPDRLAAPTPVDTLVVCGASTSGCIRASVVDGVQLGFRCIVPESAVTDRADASHRANLFDIDAKYADVVPTDAVLAELDRITRGTAWQERHGAAAPVWTMARIRAESSHSGD